MLNMRKLFFIALWFLCSPAWSVNPTPNTAKSSEPQQPHVAQSDNSGSTNDESAQKPPIVIKNIFKPEIGKESGNTERNQCCEESPWKWIWEAITSLATLILAAVTAGVVLFTRKLWQSTHGMLSAAAEQSKAMEKSNAESAKSAAAITRVADAMAENMELLKQAIATNREIAARQKLTAVMQLRPYVSPTAVNPLYAPIKDSALFSWQIRVVWNNYGSAPTRRLSLCATAEIKETVLPDTFNFPYDEGHITKGVLLPQTPLSSAYIPWGKQITPEDIEAIQAGRKFLYVWGWAKYHDAFEDTPQHITKFCWTIDILGNPRTFVPHSSDYTKQLEFRYSMLRFGNCSDEECEEQ